jgi:sugar lactone lactonase YvrE
VPVVVLSGLSSPGSTAVAPDGSVWFAQYEELQAASLWRLAPGESTATRMYSTSANRINSPQFDHSGNAYFLVSRWEEASVVQLDRKGVATTLYSARKTYPEGGESIDALAVSASGRLYVIVGSFPTWETFAGSRVLWLKRSGEAVEVASSAEGFGALAVSDTGVAYVTAFPSGWRRIYELRPGHDPQVIWQEPAVGFVVMPYLALDPAGSLYTLRRIAGGLPFDACAEPTTYQVLRFAAKGNSVSSTPTITAEGTVDGFRFLWIGDPSYFRIGPAGEAYFVSLKLACSPFIRITDFQVLQGDASGVRLIDSDTTYPSRSQPDFDVDQAGRLWVAWDTRGTLERVDP